MTERSKRNHGGSASPEYQAWSDMKQRCSNPKLRNYKNYGGRGIEVCKRWDGGFESFLADMGSRPDGGTLERINNNGNYTPRNCRWASNMEQQLNRRDNRRITVDGEAMTISQWAERLGVKFSTIGWRLDEGWPEREAVTLPPGSKYHRNVFLELDGRRQTQKEWADELGVAPSVIQWRVKQGWDLRKALTMKSTRLDPNYVRRSASRDQFAIGKGEAG